MSNRKSPRFSLCKCLIENLFYYESKFCSKKRKKIRWSKMFCFSAAKVVRFELKWIGGVSFLVKMILGITCLYLMFQRDSYQIFDRSPISAVTIKVKHSPNCSNNETKNCLRSMFDVNDFILPAIENSAVSITTRKLDVEHVLRDCDFRNNDAKNSSLTFVSFYQCDHPSRCIWSNRTNLCWFRATQKSDQYNYAALDYVLFIKHFIEFPQLSLVRHNLVSNSLTKEYIQTCEYDPKLHPYCPKFRLLKILQILENDRKRYEKMFFYGSLIELKINWKCNLDRSIDFCEPTYEFRRLDIQPYRTNPFEPGSNFLISKHFSQPDDHQLYRIHSKIFNIRLLVSVTGEAGRFDLFQTTTSIGSFLGVFGTGSIVCDLLATFISNFHKVKYET